VVFNTSFTNEIVNEYFTEDLPIKLRTYPPESR